MINKPKHPGLMVRTLCLEPLDLSVTKAAQLLKVSRPTLSKLLNGRMNISPEMAARLAIVFNTSEELWVNLQANYDIWKAQQKRKKLRLKSFVMHAAAAA